MARWLITLLAVGLAAGAGLFGGYVLWGSRAVDASRAEQRLQDAGAELTNVRQQNADLDQRLQQVSKEQERLAQENEILRKHVTTDQLTTGHGGELPSLPPK